MIVFVQRLSCLKFHYINGHCREKANKDPQQARKCHHACKNWVHVWMFFFPLNKKSLIWAPFCGKTFIILNNSKRQNCLFWSIRSQHVNKATKSPCNFSCEAYFSRGRWGLGRGGVGRVTIIGLLKGVSKSTTGYRKFQVSSIKTLNRFKCWNSRAFTDYANQFCRI